MNAGTIAINKGRRSADSPNEMDCPLSATIVEQLRIRKRQTERVNYWSSTEYSTSNAWNLNMNNGNRWNNSKATLQNRVRPVAAFLGEFYIMRIIKHITR